MMMPSKFSITALTYLVLLFLSNTVSTSTMAANVNEHAATRSQAGMTHELKQFHDDNLPHPSHGGSHGYPLWYHHHVLWMVNWYGFEVIDDLEVSTTSVYWWLLQERPYRMTGGCECKALTGWDLLLLSIGLFVYPDSKADELAAFIFHHGGELYSRQLILSCMKELDLMKKVCSMEAYQAFTEVNMHKACLFWSCPPPLGVVGCQRHHLVDIDEMAVFLEKCNPKFRHAHMTIWWPSPNIFRIVLHPPYQPKYRPIEYIFC